MLVSFFFQEEDGIREIGGTGVQPCALPICADDAVARRGPAPSIRVVDFRRTVKFKSEHQDRLKRTAETFCRIAAPRVTSELRAPTEFGLLQVEQGMWSRMHAELAGSSLCAVLAPAPDAPPIV